MNSNTATTGSSSAFRGSRKRKTRKRSKDGVAAARKPSNTSQVVSKRNPVRNCTKLPPFRYHGIDYLAQIQMCELYEDLRDLEETFMYIREMYKRERLSEIDKDIEELQAGGVTVEYMISVNELEEKHEDRLDKIEELRRLRLQNLEVKYDAESDAIQQNYENDKQTAYDKIKVEIKEKMARVSRKVAGLREARRRTKQNLVKFSWTTCGPV